MNFPALPKKRDKYFHYQTTHILETSVLTVINNIENNT